MCRLSRFRHECNGAAAVEMAFALPIFLTFLFGAIGLGHAFWVNNTLEYALDYGGRYAMLHATASATEITTEIRSHVTGITPSQVTVSVATNISGTLTNKTITVTYNYSFLSGIADFLPTRFSRHITVPVIE